VSIFFERRLSAAANTIMNMRSKFFMSPWPGNFLFGFMLCTCCGVVHRISSDTRCHAVAHGGVQWGKKAPKAVSSAIHADSPQALMNAGLSNNICKCAQAR
jgi:hypothetical protein